MRRTARKAFTLVEILIVVVILGILAAIVVPQFSSAADDARASNTASQLSTLQNAIELFRARNGRYPDFNSNGWDELTGDENANGTFDEVGENEYLKEEPVNPINQDADVSETSAATVGWVWNDTTDRIEATFYNEDTGEIQDTHDGS
ncbi:MAG: prepilin-type N-terminal cleavage/methylation domain-containing protein [Planctomycetota bacterium]